MIKSPPITAALMTEVKVVCISLQSFLYGGCAWAFPQQTQQLLPDEVTRVVAFCSDWLASKAG
jgi:hypothetical protein